MYPGQGRVSRSRDQCEIRTFRVKLKLTIGQGRQLSDQPGNIELHPALVQLLQESLALDPSVLVEQVLFRVGNGDDLELASQGWGRELREDGGSYSAETDEGDRDDTGS